MSDSMPEGEACMAPSADAKGVPASALHVFHKAVIGDQVILSAFDLQVMVQRGRKSV